MKRSRLENKANKTKSFDHITKRQKRNLVLNLNKKAKFEYFSKFDLNIQAKSILVTSKPHFSNKHSKAHTNIMLDENAELIMKNKEIAKTFNDHFGLMFEKFVSVG